jgi:plastocyanin
MSTFTGTPGADSIDGTSGGDTIIGLGDGDSLLGLLGNDRIAGDSGDDTLLGGGGNDTIFGGPGNDSIDGNEGADRVEAGAGNDTLVGDGEDRLSGDAGDDLFVLSGSGNVAAGGGGIDTITFSTPGTYTITSTPLGFTIAGPGATTNTATSMEFINGPGGDSVFGAGSFFVCFAGGTRITTATGEVEVENLRAGDLVATLSGKGTPMKPVLWVGRRRVVLTNHPQAEALAPVRIGAGALGQGMPHRDLLVSPDHCMFLDGALVPARLLVNGSTITVERGMAEVTWFHVELEQHDVLLAEGAAAESWLDCDNRSWFENAAVAQIAVSGTLADSGTGWDASRTCAPLVHGGPELATIRAAIAARATEVATPAATAVAA